MGVAEGLTEELLRLIANAEGKEHPDLDFKRDIILQSASDKAELAKDVAAQANLPNGGSIVYGVTNDGRAIGLHEDPDSDRVASILSPRLQFAPPGIRIDVVSIPMPEPGRVSKLLWIRVPPTPHALPTCAQTVGGGWKAPVRIDSVTSYLNAAEALTLFLGRQKGHTFTVPPRLPELTYDADPDPVSEKLDSNLLPVLQLPSVLWTSKTDYSSKEIREIIGKRIVPHRVVKGRVCTFRPPSEAASAFVEVTSTKVSLLETARLMKDRDWRYVIISLLNQELGRFLVRKGLLWDEDGGRAYFAPENGGTKKVSWKAFSRTGTRTVVGIKFRAKDEVDHWFHFAVSLRVQDLDSKLAVLVSPDWFFTYDGVEALQSFDVASAATPRLNREDNARLLYNTYFWAQFLSGSARQIEIPLGGGPLLVAAEPLKLNVPFGIARDRIQVPDAPADLDSPPEITWHNVDSVEEQPREDLEKWS
ncbi:MAG: ATP-binding protein [Nitrososphaerota archaeon]|nr:ATP-binding protein [Nitrososphaerota archaeon]